MQKDLSESVRKLKRDWEDLGTIDPFWAVWTSRKNQFGKWNVDEFFKTGDRDIEEVMQFVAELGYPKERNSALDFGCGAGRLTRALTKYFTHCSGVDISESMVAKARELNHDISNCCFFVNAEDHLRMFSSESFDLVYTKCVLQHLPNRALIKSYIGEFMRTLKTGGLLVFQLRTELTLRARARLGFRLYRLLRALGIKERFLYQRMRLSPMRLTFVPEEEVRAMLKEFGAKVLHIKGYSIPTGQSQIYCVTK